MQTLFDDWPADAEEQIWQAYPRRVAKAAMRKALNKIRQRGDVKFDIILLGIERYKAWLGQRSSDCWRPEPKHPATYLNGECWKDEFGGDYNEATRSIGAAAERLDHAGFSFGARPSLVLPQGGAGDVRLLPKK